MMQMLLAALDQLLAARRFQEVAAALDRAELEVRSGRLRDGSPVGDAGGRPAAPPPGAPRTRPPGSPSSLRCLSALQARQCLPGLPKTSP